MKNTLRKKLSIIRSELPDEYREKSSNEITQRCCEWLASKKVEILALYYPIGNEVNMLMLADFCHKNKITMALPVDCGFATWEVTDQLQINKHGIKQPIKSRDLAVPDVIIVPLIGFDRGGNRIGYGGGFYDRVLSTMPSAIKLGVAYSVQEQREIPYEAHDIKLNLIITEKEVITANDCK